MQYNTINTMQYNAMAECNAMQYNTIKYNAMQCNTIQCNAIQYNKIQCNTMQCNTIQYNTISIVIFLQFYSQHMVPAYDFLDLQFVQKLPSSVVESDFAVTSSSIHLNSCWLVLHSPWPIFLCVRKCHLECRRAASLI